MLVAFHLAFLFLLNFACAASNKLSAPSLRFPSEAPSGPLQDLAAPSKLRRRAYSPENATSTILPLAISDDGRHYLPTKPNGPLIASSSYYTVIQVGDISFRVSLDTGSSDFWLLSSACSDSDPCGSSPTYPLLYDSPSFRTVNDNQTSFSLSFADGTSSSGFLAAETVQAGNVTRTEQVFGLANSTDVQLDSDISGVLGMGFPRLSTFSSSVNSTPFVSGLVQDGVLDYPLFGISLTRDDGGTLALGAIDANVVQNLSTIEWHRVLPFSPFNIESNTSSYLHWVIRLPEIGASGTNIETEPTYPNITQTSLALIDVGTNGIFGPYQDVSRLFELFGEARLVDAEAGQWAVPCDTQQVITFNFGQGNITLQPADFLIGPTSGNPTLCLTWPRGVQNSGDGIDWQLGTPFLRTVYSIFSYGINGKEAPVIGFYPLSNSTTIAENATALSSFFSSAHATIATTLPNSLLPTPTPSTAEYIFNTSVSASVGELVTTALGDENYSAILTGDINVVNASALPVITPAPTIVTLIVTDQSGAVSTSIEHISTSSLALGVPPGESSALHSYGHVPLSAVVGILAVFWGLLSTV